MTDHETFAHWSAAYVLGALDSNDRRIFEGHLGTCPRCQHEVRQFAPIPGLLTRVESYEPVVVPESVFEGALERARGEQSRLRKSRNRWRWAALASMVTAVALLVLSLPAWIGPERTVFPLDSELSVSGRVALEEKAWGTAVLLEMEGLPHRDVYIAWAIDREGEWQQVAIWGPGSGPRVSVAGACSWPASRLSTILITTDDPGEILASGQIEHS